MRILIANDGLDDGGGVQTYLDAVTAALESRGHAIALAYCRDAGREPDRGIRRFASFKVSDDKSCEGLQGIERWGPDVCYSHNMSVLAVDRALVGLAPTIKFMHGYFGVCVSGSKMHAFPRPAACRRTYGGACLALYLPRRCGCLSLRTMAADWHWAEAQRSLFARYAAIVVASDHMGAEYVRSGVDRAKVLVNPLFASRPAEAIATQPPPGNHVVFLGRMTFAKGGDVLVRAVRHAINRLARPIALSMVGDGPQRAEWQALAGRLGLECRFTGWVDGERRWSILREASVVAVPSLWPEPFGLVGLEAGSVGVPAVAFDAGGISQWLRSGVNGVLVETPTPAALGDALAGVLGDRDRLTALRNGALRLAREMSLAAHVDRLEALFGSACGASAAVRPTPCASC